MLSRGRSLWSIRSSPHDPTDCDRNIVSCSMYSMPSIVLSLNHRKQRLLVFCSVYVLLECNQHDNINRYFLINVLLKTRQIKHDNVFRLEYLLLSQNSTREKRKEMEWLMITSTTLTTNNISTNQNIIRYILGNYHKSYIYIELNNKCITTE